MDEDRRCRHCRKYRQDAPIEILAHIWGACETVKDMRIARHDEVVKMLADECRKNEKWEVTVEERTAEGLKPDNIIRSKDEKKSWVIDPTIRMEVDEDNIVAHNKEKERKYSGVADEIRVEGFVDVEVHGLWIGARGVFSKVSLALLKSLGIGAKFVSDIVCLVINLSHSMYWYRMFMRQ